MATVKFTASGAGSWTVPPGVTSVFVQVVGGGGVGQGNAFSGTNKGGGGDYAEKTLAVTPGSVISYRVGKGGDSGSSTHNGEASWFSSLSTVAATGGRGASGSLPSDVTTGDVIDRGASQGTTGNAGGPIGGTGGVGNNPGNPPGGGGGAALVASGQVWNNGAVGTVWLTFNSAPSAPTLTAPANGATIAVDQSNDFTWTINDPDGADAQSEATLRWKATGDDTWTEETISGSTPSWTAAAATFTDGVDYEWQVKTKDTGGPVYGPYSASSFFTGGTTPPPGTVTAPSPGTISSTETEIAWDAVDGQQAYQVEVVGDDGGDPDFTAVYFNELRFDSGATTTLSGTVPFPTNNVDRHVVARWMVGNLFSNWYDVAVHVEYTDPPIPTVVATVSTDPPTITLAITNPTPGEGQPDLDHNEVWVNDTDAGWQRRAVVAENGSWTYDTPAATLDYDPEAGAHLYVLAVGTNGSGASSADAES